MYFTDVCRGSVAVTDQPQVVSLPVDGHAVRLRVGDYRVTLHPACVRQVLTNAPRGEIHASRQTCMRGVRENVVMNNK